MKVTGYVYIAKTWYLHCHRVGVTTDTGLSYAIPSHRDIPKTGEAVNTQWSYELSRQDFYVPLTKLHKHLHGLEHEI